MPLHGLHIGLWDLRTWTLFGWVPFLALMLILFLAGRRRGGPWRSALLATTALAAGLSLGAALLPSVLGAAAGGIAMWLLAQRALGLRRPPYAALALSLLAVIAVGRWGCLLNDCCFGRVTSLPWAIHYCSGSATWLLHRALGWIAPHASASLGVHPYPVYESVGLLLWLPMGLVLARRLRCEAALLALTAAWDLALRGCIDGTRAMINVWWALLGSWLGLNLFQWALLVAALLSLVLGLGLEWRARRHTQPMPAPAAAREPAPVILWGLFLGLWTVGWLSDAEQTLFLHRVLVAALALSTLALRLPTWVPGTKRLRAWAAPALATALLLPLALHIERSAEAKNPTTPDGATVGSGRGWIYDVDARHGAMVRVGSEQEDPASLARRREALALPPEPAAPESPPGHASHTWVGGGIMGGADSYKVQESCSDSYTLHDRHGGGGWLQAEQEINAGDSSVFWLGGRAGALFESRTQTEGSQSGLGTSSQFAEQAWFGQLWAEIDHPNFAFGLGGMAGVELRSLDGGSSSTSAAYYPGGHLRAGLSFLSLDLGVFDRQSFTGYPTAHIGLSGAIGRDGHRIRHPDDSLFRLFLGALDFPGADLHMSHFMPGCGLECFVSPRLVLGFQGAVGSAGGSFGAYVRSRLGK